ncbi:M13 family metallopeptidase [Ilyomonas limi]|uniref:M13 family metallopeptidase n=1 Tax=Ilyomonas limi TaxID=2575867 RepID=A0A4V5UUP0_9BACT|nr:M13 family metallopeptidase [Ilyomonas limi]TKK69833.1 M13 family metallopeptidase [Ilyomonas limi]
MKNCFLFLSFCLLFVACRQDAKPVSKDVLVADLDKSVSPANDFFNYANGGWIKANPIPDEQSSWGIGNLVIEENLKRLRTICEEAAKSKATPGSIQQKIGDFWLEAMDSTKIEGRGLRPIAYYLQQIASVKDIPTLTAAMAQLEKIGVNTAPGMYVAQDDKNSNMMALQLVQSGLFLDDREYYFNQDTTYQNIRAAYHQFIQRFLELSGNDSTEANKLATDIIALETSLAESHRKLEDTRDPYKNYYKMSVGSLDKLTPSFRFVRYFQMVGVPPTDSVIVHQPEYYKALETELKNTPIDVWKAYLRFRLIDEYSQALPEVYGQAAFDFSKVLYGAKVRKPRWKRVIATENNLLGEPLGQLYVKKFFTEKAKQRYSSMVEDIRAALKSRIQHLTWMSDSTKQKALVKLAAMKKKVGYPEKWKDFSAMQIGRESYVQNLMNANAWWVQYNFNKLGKPVDRDEWEMTPQTYNAYYNPSNNEIVLPAGMFTVPGATDEQIDDAVAYGYAGASTIGHEITHGFDDQGRLYDKDGNLTDWWTKEDAQRFEAQADKMVNQFNSFQVIDTFKINGKATLGENIADLGGVLLGWDAFTKTKQYKENKMIDSLTPAQRFFLGYALGWMHQSRPEALRAQLMSDVHSPAMYRVNGPMQNVDAFYQAFHLQPGNKMYVPDSARVRIW